MQLTRAARIRNQIRRRVSALGPGMIFALAVIGAGDIVSNAAAGADYGYSLLWMLLVTLVFRYVWIGTAAKYVLVSGETLLAGYRRIGRWTVWTLLGAMVVLRHVSNLYKIVLFGTIASFFLPLPGSYSDAVWSLVFTGLGFGMMFWGGYPFIERVFKTLVVGMGSTLLIGAAYSQPDLGAIASGILNPSLPDHRGLYDLSLLLMALIGTEAGSMTNLTYTYFMREKGWVDRSHLQSQRIDLLSSVACIFLMGALVQVAAAGTLGRGQNSLESVGDLLQLLGHSPGIVTVAAFAIGLIAAVFTGFVGATSGYALIVTDIIRNVLPEKSRAVEKPRDHSFRDPVYRSFVALWALSPLYVLFVDVEPIWLLLAATAFSVIAIPFLAFCLLWISNDRSQLGDQVNHWSVNATLGLLGLLSLALCLERVWRWWP